MLNALMKESISLYIYFKGRLMTDVLTDEMLSGLEYRSLKTWKRSKIFLMLKRFEANNGDISMNKLTDDSLLFALNDLITDKYMDFWDKIFVFTDCGLGLEGEVEEIVNEIKDEYLSIKEYFKKYSHSKIKHLSGIQKIINEYKLSKDEVEILYYFLTRDYSLGFTFFFLESNCENLYRKISIITGIRLQYVKTYLLKSSKLVSSGLIVKNKNKLMISEKLERIAFGDKLQKRKEVFEKFNREFEINKESAPVSQGDSGVLPRYTDEELLEKCKNVLDLRILSNFNFGKRIHIVFTKDKNPENSILSEEFQKILKHLDSKPRVIDKTVEDEIKKCNAIFKYEDVLRTANAILDKDNSKLLEILKG